MGGQKHLKAPETAGAPIQCRSNAPCRILVVDDEPDIRQINAVVLRRAGYQVDTAEDGQAGWQAVRHAPESYAILITAHDMPGLTGLALVKKLRDASMTLPAIMATAALPELDLLDRYPWLQPAVALLKPYSVGQLLGTVEKSCARLSFTTRDLRRRPTGRAGQYRVVCSYDDSSPRSGVQRRFLRLGLWCGAGSSNPAWVKHRIADAPCAGVDFQS